VNKNDLCPHVPGFVKRRDDHRGLRLEVIHVGSEMVDDYWDGKTIVNPFWRAYIADRPGVALTHAGRRLPYHIDRITVIPAWVPFVFHTAPDVGHAYIHFNVVDVSGDLQRQLFPGPFSLGDQLLLDDFRTFARDLVNDQQSALLGLGGQSLAQRVLLNAFLTLSGHQRAQLEHAQQGRGRLAPALTFIDENLDQTIGVSDLGDILAVGKAHCIRIFKQHLGQTPMQYILDRRIERAAALITNENDTLDEIAAQVGLGERRYLSRVFRQRLGMRPSDYRMKKPALLPRTPKDPSL
jgi:AraC-like DNA-binding protein